MSVFYTLSAVMLVALISSAIYAALARREQNERLRAMAAHIATETATRAKHGTSPAPTPSGLSDAETEQPH